MSLVISGKVPVNSQSDLYRTLLLAAPKIAEKDFTLWGKSAEAESKIRLNWVDLPEQSLKLLPKLAELKEWAQTKNLSEFILAGMGGSSLGPEVLAKTFAKKLTIVDSTDPLQILDSTPSDLSRVGIIVGSKSGSTAETASQKAYFTQALIDQGLDPKNHFIIITDPASPFDVASRNDGYFVINADPNVGGRFSVLSAFGLVPAALIGIDVGQLLADAAESAEHFTKPESAAVELAVRILEAGKQNLSFFDSGSSVPGLADWIEQLIAESTGKEDQGFFPIAIESMSAPVAGDSLRIGFSEGDFDITVHGSLGEQFILWEWVTALIAIPLHINPFDQPNVQDAKVRALALLEKWNNLVPQLAPAFETNNIQVFAMSDSQSLVGQIRDLLDHKHMYTAVMAYLARGLDDEVTALRPLVAEVSGTGTSFGWGPRFLHSTGQFHKGGPKNGLFIQITGESDSDLDIPGQPFSFHTLLMAQALGDGEALLEKKLPLVRFHLKNRAAGIAELIGAFKELL
jgi:glucose-6-phosphate isomerase